MPHVCYYVDISKFPLKSDKYSTNSDKIKSCLASFKRQGLAGLPVNTSQAVCVCGKALPGGVENPTSYAASLYALGLIEVVSNHVM